MDDLNLTLGRIYKTEKDDVLVMLTGRIAENSVEFEKGWRFTGNDGSVYDAKGISDRPEFPNIVEDVSSHLLSSNAQARIRPTLALPEGRRQYRSSIVQGRTWIVFDITGVVEGVRLCEMSNDADAEPTALALNAYEPTRTFTKLVLYPGKAFIDKQGLTHHIELRKSDRARENLDGFYYQDQSGFVYNESGKWDRPGLFKTVEVFDLVKEVDPKG